MSQYEFEEEEFTTEFNGKTVWRILKQALPHWPWLVGFLLAIASVSGIDSYSTYLSKRIVDEGIVAGDRAMLTSLVTQYGGLILIQSVGVFAFIYLCGILGEMVRYDLRKKMFEHLQTLSFSYFDRTPVGWIISRVTSDSGRIAQLVTWGLLDLTWGFMNITTGLYFMLVINWRLGLIMLGIVPVLVVVAALFRRKIIVEFRNARKVHSKITGAYNENITGVRVV
ncbi:MAG: ABC transporter transmembrane domain-containing protein, partial [Anaerolineae bacterium]